MCIGVYGIIGENGGNVMFRIEEMAMSDAASQITLFVENGCILFEKKQTHYKTIYKVLISLLLLFLLDLFCFFFL